MLHPTTSPYWRYSPRVLAESGRVDSIRILLVFADSEVTRMPRNMAMKNMAVAIPSSIPPQMEFAATMARMTGHWI